MYIENIKLYFVDMKNMSLRLGLIHVNNSCELFTRIKPSLSDIF